jgi:hypothetical protein
MSPEKTKSFLPKKYDPYVKEVEEAFRMARKENSSRLNELDPTYGGAGWRGYWNIKKTSKGFKMIGKVDRDEIIEINRKTPKAAAKQFILTNKVTGKSLTKREALQDLNEMKSEAPLRAWIRATKWKPRKKK